MANILAIHTGHDASIAYWREYDQVAIIKEERLNRIKNWGKGFPHESFLYIKDFINIREIDILTFKKLTLNFKVKTFKHKENY